MNSFVSAILLSGGKGLRMGHATPKQYLPLENKPIVLYSFEILARHPRVDEVIVVCEEEWIPLFEQSERREDLTLHFAPPGKLRQHSLESGLQKVSREDALVLVHDAARPFLPPLEPLLEEVASSGAAVFSMPVEFTVKQSTPSLLVEKTLDRSQLHEIQTPQAARYALLVEGLEKAKREELTVTDDVSLVELLGKPVKLVKGSKENFKITTTYDLHYAHYLLNRRAKA